MRDLQTPKRRHRQQGGNDGDGDTSSSPSKGETDDKRNNVDGIHGDGGRLTDEFKSGGAEVTGPTAFRWTGA